MPFGLIVGGLIAGGSSLLGSLFGASATETATQQQVSEEQQALAFQEQEYNTNQAQEAPFLQEGQYSVGQLMNDFQNGTFGPGSVPGFTAPTLAQAQQQPGYQFTQQQGDLGIEEGAAAAGGAFTTGTLKSLDQYNSGLADSTYQQVFNNSLASYQQTLATQAQGYNQLAAGAGLGQTAASSLGTTGAAAANTVGSTLTNIGATEAAGTIGTANALTSGINGVASAATLPLYLQYLQSGGTNSTLSNTLPQAPGWQAPQVPAPANPTYPSPINIPPDSD